MARSGPCCKETDANGSDGKHSLIAVTPLQPLQDLTEVAWKKIVVSQPRQFGKPPCLDELAAANERVT